MDRREFIKAVGAGSVAAALPTTSAYGGEIRRGRIVPSDQKLRIACVGCGGKGHSDIRGVATEEIVALCDVDLVMAGRVFHEFPQARKYRDFRHMLIEMDDQIDAVTVSTPDHMHFPVAMMAITMGKHVFVQKPMAHTLWEARQLTLAARRHEVVTQMGNQGHAGEGIRLMKEWMMDGAIGEVREVHAWSEKFTPGAYLTTRRDRPKDTPPVPPTLNWNAWLGTARWRPYSPEYCPRKWRKWWEFGGGVLGDIGCHLMDGPFFALDLGAPVSVEAETAPFNDETFPDWSVVTYRFPARGKRPPVKMVWYDGGKRPPRPKHLEASRKTPTRGQVWVGSGNRSLMDTSEKCQSPRLIPESEMKAYAPHRPAKSIPRIPKGSPHQEWVRACKGGPKPGSNFDYSGPLSETVLLGNLAIRARKRIEWNSERFEITNDAAANELLRASYRRY